MSTVDDDGEGHLQFEVEQDDVEDTDEFENIKDEKEISGLNWTQYFYYRWEISNIRKYHLGKIDSAKTADAMNSMALVMYINE